MHPLRLLKLGLVDYNFGFKGQRRVQLLLGGLQTLIRKRCEWFPKESSAIYFCAGDAASAFGNMLLEKVDYALRTIRVPSNVIACLAQRTTGMQCTPILAGCQADPFHFNKAAPQGGSHSPICWNALTLALFSKLHSKWFLQGLGFQIPEMHIQWTWLAWVDNWFLLSHSLSGLRSVVQDLVDEVSLWRPALMPNSVEWSQRCHQIMPVPVRLSAIIKKGTPLWLHESNRQRGWELLLHGPVPCARLVLSNDFLLPLEPSGIRRAP